MNTNLTTLFNAFRLKGQLFLVGGCVRDKILGKTPKDFDLVTNLLPEKINNIIKTIPGWSAMEVGESFGIVFTVAPDGEQFEIASFRSDSSGRKPTVTLGVTIEEDVNRRDFTINAMFMDEQGTVFDRVGGCKDIENKTLCTVGNPLERFTEDPLRIVRAVRFAANLGFTIEQNTLKAIKDINSLNEVSKERIFLEFQKVKDFNKFQELLRVTGLDIVIFENSNPDKFNFNTMEEFLVFNLKFQTSKFLNNLEVNMKIPSVVANRVRALVKILENDFNIRKMSSFVKEDSVFFDNIKMPIITKLKNFVPTVTAEELMSQGIKGKELGETLQRMDAKQINNPDDVDVESEYEKKTFKYNTLKQEFVSLNKEIDTIKNSLKNIKELSKPLNVDYTRQSGTIMLVHSLKFYKQKRKDLQIELKQLKKEVRELHNQLSKI